MGPDSDVERARATGALARARRARQEHLSKRGKRSPLHIMRNLVGFHYPDNQKLRRTIRKHLRARPELGRLEGSLVLSPAQGIGRYTVADHLMKLVIADEVGGLLIHFRKRYMDSIGEALEVADAMGDVVDYLIRHTLVGHVNQIEECDDIIRIDPAIVRARKAVERRRRRVKA